MANKMLTKRLCILLIEIAPRSRSNCPEETPMIQLEEAFSDFREESRA
jgi:hypothetical protein